MFRLNPGLNTFSKRTREARTKQKGHVERQGDHLLGADESKIYLFCTTAGAIKKGIITKVSG